MVLAEFCINSVKLRRTLNFDVVHEPARQQIKVAVAEMRGRQRSSPFGGYGFRCDAPALLIDGSQRRCALCRFAL